MRGATPTNRPCKWPIYFNPHSPCGERRKRQSATIVHSHISIHTPLAGSDLSSRIETICISYFNPHSPCGERLFSGDRLAAKYRISIHTPLAGSDRGSGSEWQDQRDFNPHSPCGERRHRQRHRLDTGISIHTPLAGSDKATITDAEVIEFQSTLPLRGATRPLR